MSRVSLQEWLSKLPSEVNSGNTVDVPEAFVTEIILDGANGPVVRVFFKEPISGEKLIELESVIARRLGADYCLISHAPTGELSSEEVLSYASKIYPWILKHSKMAVHVYHHVLSQLEIAVETGNPELVVPENLLEIVEGRPYIWLQEFVRDHTMLPAVPTIRSTASVLVDSGNRHNTARPEELAKVIEQINFQPKVTYNGSGRGTKGRWHEGGWGRFLKKTVPEVAVKDIAEDLDRVHTRGYVFAADTRVTKNDRLMVKFGITDRKNSVGCIIYADLQDEERFDELFSKGYAEIEGRVQEDKYLHEMSILVDGLRVLDPPPRRPDTAAVKRVELHQHSKMSAKDAVSSVKEIVEAAAGFGHKAIAITDHAVVQGFPEAAMTAAKLRKAGKDIKLIYGIEGYLVNDGATAIWQPEKIDIDKGFVCFSVETDSDNPKTANIVAIEAKKFVPGENTYIPTDTFNGRDDTVDSVQDTSINNITGFPKARPEEQDLLRAFLDFCDELPLVADNALAQINYLRYAAFRLPPKNARLKFNPTLVDIRDLTHYLKPELAEADLGEIADAIEIAEDKSGDANTVAGLVLLKLMREFECETLAELNTRAGHKDFETLRREKAKTSHIIVLAEDYLGLYNLYRLVSVSHLEDFYYRPRIRRSWLRYYAPGIRKGSACIKGEVFARVLAAYEEAGLDYEKALPLVCTPEMKEISDFYDHLEIMPLTNNSYLLTRPQNPMRTKEDLKNLNRLVVALGEYAEQPVVATCDAHFVDKDDFILRSILQSDMGYEEREEEAELYLRTTDEMLEEFSYLGSQKAMEVVVENTLAVADSILPGMVPFPEGSYPPIVEDSAEVLRKRVAENALAKYGREGKLPQLVENRIAKELNSIIDNGFAVMYYVASELVRKSNADGYIVGSRGSVGSSLVATLCDITEVNPLPPHYVCPVCHNTEFDDSGEYGSGFDLPPRDCKLCGTAMIKDGQDIPFETFLGFEGTKQPDIDLNFSGVYQPRAHKFIEEMFSEKNTFRAGTISGYAQKNSFAMVKNYSEKTGINYSSAEMMRLAEGLMGVKRTTGQHPGGIVIVPHDRDIYDFTPIQYPADKASSGVITTHFDFHALSETILKFDVLGHDEPTMLKMLGDITGIDVTTIPIPDPEVMSLFVDTKVLGIAPEESSVGTAVIGLSEVGTVAARRMIAETQPKLYHDLVQISGLSHGTGVWAGNAQDLIQNGTCTINDVIGCRDSIMSN